MEEKEKFTLLYESLQDIFKMYMDVFWRTFTAIVIIIGWVVTSEDTQVFLGSHNVNTISLIAIALSGLIHCYSSWTYYSFSKQRMRLLDKLEFVDAEYYAHCRISLLVLITNLALNLSAIATLLAIVYILRK